MEISLREKLSEYPHEWHEELMPKIQSELEKSCSSIVVLDDDPTGTQTVYDIPVLTSWSVNDIKREFENNTRLFYILTNSRSVSQSEAKELAGEIGKNLNTASNETKKPFTVISRSDSTLRGHFPAELDALAESLGKEDAVRVIIPFFLEGGRYTIGDVHYVSENNRLIPAGDTQFAEDAVFGYTSSNLCDWIEEKTKGRITSDSVFSISLEDIRKKGPGYVANKLKRCPRGGVCIVNAVSYRDLEVVVLGLIEAEKEGLEFLYRTAASFVRVRGGLYSRSLLSAEQFNLPGNNGGLIIVGSYVPKSSQQLFHLLKNGHIRGIEIKTTEVLSNGYNTKKTEDILSEIEKIISDGLDVVLYTSREQIRGENNEQNLEIGKRISDFLVHIVKNISIKPRYILAKGGITSSDIITKGLNVKRATVLGQIIPGVPVWQLDNGSRFPGLLYIVFPGNVGETNAITNIVTGLTGNRN